MGAAGIARQLGGTRQGHNGRAPCPCACGYGLSLCDSADGHLLLHCYGGCDFPRVYAELVQYGLLDGDDGDLGSPAGDPIVPFRDDADQRRRKVQQAREIYESGGSDERIAVYLHSREIWQTSPVLRFTEQAPHRLGARLPAMLAPVVDVDGAMIGVHMTFLKKDGAGKADLPKEYQRECRGAIRGGAIRLLPFNPVVELVVAEGVENALAAAQFFSLPAWSAVSADGLKRLDLPSDVRKVIIAVDNDRAGRRCAVEAYDRLRTEGRVVRAKVPPDGAADFNDEIKLGANA
jgi:putative DNA primase/helicase